MGADIHATVLLRLERKKNDTTFHLETYFDKPKLDTPIWWEY
jgi:hypothetical protein